MQELLDTKNEFALMQRAKSFAHAGRGVWVFVKTTQNAWIQIVLLIITIILGLYLHINKTEWICITLCAGFVFAAEAFNTAIEIDINLTSPSYHPYAKDTKDVAAGAVLIASMTACIVGILIFYPYVLRFVF